MRTSLETADFWLNLFEVGVPRPAFRKESADSRKLAATSPSRGEAPAGNWGFRTDRNVKLACLRSSLLTIRFRREFVQQPATRQRRLSGRYIAQEASGKQRAEP